jgi:pyruvate dehydrogenase E2 component (dihydrolipoyllysine-residue acetyltransferase)
MSNEITMPKLSDTMEEGKILRWLKQPGNEIRRGDAIAEVETDKADMVIEAFEEGVLEEIKLNQGQSAPVGAVIATMRLAGEPPMRHAPGAGIAADKAPEERAPAAEQAAAPATLAREDFFGDSGTFADGVNGAEDTEAIDPASVAPSSAAPTAFPRPPRRAAAAKSAEAAQDELEGEEHQFRASPLARRTAEEAGVELANVRGSGPDGRITKRDVDNYLREQQMFKFRRLVHPHEGAPGSREELSRMRRTIAHRTAASKREIPHFYVTVEVDMDEAVKFKKSLEAVELFDVDITYNDMIVKALALALERFPRMNASYDNDRIVIHPSVNIGFAVAVEDGLIIPVVKGCEHLSLPEIARVAHRLVGKAAGGAYTAEELSGATFTISNMGMAGVEHFAAVIVPPQAAILAVSSIKDRPVVRDGELKVGKTMMVTVSCDHRIIDGIVGARFLQELKRFLENPASLLV